MHALYEAAGRYFYQSVHAFYKLRFLTDVTPARRRGLALTSIVSDMPESDLGMGGIGSKQAVTLVK